MQVQVKQNTQEVNLFDVGDRIRILRTTQKRTLQEIADGCGLSKSMISKIENCKTVPSVATLIKIAQILGTTISVLLEKEGWAKAVVNTRGEAMEQLVSTDKGYAIFPYAAQFHGKKMQPFLFKAQKGEVIPHQLSHEGEEFIYIIEGEMKMQVAEVTYLLKKGDTLYFNSMQKHGIIPVSDEVVYLDIFV